MTDITELALRLKLEVHLAVSNFNPQMNIKTRDLKELVEALEKAQRANGHLRDQSAEWERKAISNFEECAKLSQRVEELESRTVTVKLPEPPGPMSVGARTVYFGIVADVVSAFQYGITAAGIKVEVE
ncbi:hypothetical protein PG938_04720 [Klebsiella pneumoniae]